MQVNRNEFVTAFSFALDFLEKSIRENVTNHNRRVSLIAVRLGRALGLNDRALFDLSAYAMLHDNGLCSATRFLINRDNKNDKMSLGF